jgi:two-component system cell cycle response regulator
VTANVLVVDDIQSNVKLLEIKLLGEYYTVFTANDGEKALDILSNNKIDVVLLDVMMPNMDGFEICKRIKSTHSTSHIPVVMVTALSDTDDRVKGLEAGADEFLTKPIDDIALFARVRSLARMKAVIDELKLRNATNAELGGAIIEMVDNFANNKILLINDDLVQARNIKEILHNLTSQVRLISDIDDLGNNDSYIPDLAIISCELECGDPLRIAMMLKSNAKFRDIVIVLQAEEENTSLVIKGLELGINDYFIYPIDRNELLARIKTQLRKKLYQDNLRNDLELSVNLAIKDGLTGIFNRHYFDIHIKQMVKKSSDRKKSLCLLMCDIDYFKDVNDQYGHQVGDVVIKTIAMTIKNIFRVTDLTARYGGEEFAVLLNDIKLDQAVHIAEKVRVAIELLDFKVKNQECFFKKTISIGVTEYKIGEPICAFIERADQALYRAKELGRNKIEQII